MDNIAHARLVFQNSGSLFGSTKACDKKHAFALLLGTERKISFPDFIARLLDVAKMLSPRLFVLSDVASVELLEKSFIECAERRTCFTTRRLL